MTVYSPQGVANVATAAKQTGAQRVVLISSCLVTQKHKCALRLELCCCSHVHGDVLMPSNSKARTCAYPPGNHATQPT